MAKLDLAARQSKRTECVVGRVDGNLGVRIGLHADGVKRVFRIAGEREKRIRELEPALPAVGTRVRKREAAAREVHGKRAIVAQKGVCNGLIRCRARRKVERARPKIDAARTLKPVNELRRAVQKNDGTRIDVEGARAGSVAAEDVVRAERKSAVLNKRCARVIVRFVRLRREDDGLIVTGPTGTNVNDVAVALVR